MSAEAGRWRETPTEDGSWTLLECRLEEACHSLSGAWQQARERYALGCRLEERVGPAGGAAQRWSAGFRLLDVGTGLGLNLAAALAALAPHGVALHALSLECDPTVIEAGLALYARLARAEAAWEPWHGEVRQALRAALEAGGRPVALGARGTLALCLGDARTSLPALRAARFDAVFLDPFSPQRAPELWQEAFLAEVARHLAPDGWLATYSAAFRVRLALARAGLRVGRGARVGKKGEGTLASPECAPPPLAPRLARRLARRSERPLPAP